MPNSKFDKGDVVKSRNGKVLYDVVSKKSAYDLKIRSQNSGKLVNYASDYDYILVTSAEAVEKERNMTKLYEFPYGGKTVFGTKLAVNSAHQAVMEIKGVATPVVIDPDHLTEVMPYTIQIKNAKNTNTYHVETAQGKVKVGDVLISKMGELYIVTGIDTKKYATNGGPNIVSRIKTDSFKF